MYVTADDIRKLEGELVHVVEALKQGRTVELMDPVDGWVETKQINLFKGRSDYRILN